LSYFVAGRFLLLWVVFTATVGSLNAAMSPAKHKPLERHSWGRKLLYYTIVPDFAEKKEIYKCLYNLPAIICATTYKLSQQHL
jgi:hypothetical protein